MESIIYLKISKGGDWFITAIEGLNIDEILNLTKQSNEAGWKIESSTYEEKESVLDMPFLAQNRMERVFEEWDKDISWESIF